MFYVRLHSSCGIGVDPENIDWEGGANICVICIVHFILLYHYYLNQ